MLLGVESTLFGFVGRLLIAHMSLLTMLVILSADLSAMMSRLPKKTAEFPCKAVDGIFQVSAHADQLLKVRFIYFCVVGSIYMYAVGFIFVQFD